MKSLILLVTFFICIHAQTVDEFAKTIENYYTFLRQKEFHKAYNLLSHAIVQDTNHSHKNNPSNIPDGYNYWFSLVKNSNLDSVYIFKLIECKSDSNDNKEGELIDSDEEKCYETEFLKIGDKDTTNILQNVGGYIWVKKGSDEKIKMVGMHGLFWGTGP